MKTINFSEKIKGMEWSPDYLKRMLDGTEERLSKIIKSLAGTTSGIIILEGCEMTVSGSDYSQTAGTVFYNGKIYTVDSFSGTATGANIPVWVLDVQEEGTEALFGDGVYRNVFLEQNMKLQFGLSGTGLYDWDDAGVKNIDVAYRTGFFEPTIVSGSGFSSFSLNKAFYERNGNLVKVSGKFSCNYSGSNNPVVIHIELPFESEFTDEFDLNGILQTNNGTDSQSSLSCVAIGQVGGTYTNTAKFFGNQSANSQTGLVVCYSFTYIIK